MPVRIIQKGKPSTAEDVLRSIPTGLTEGISAAVGSLGDLRSAGEWAAGKVGDMMGVEGMRLPLPRPMETLSSIAGAVSRKMGVDPSAARLVTALTSPGGLSEAPTTEEVKTAVTNGEPLYEPQTRAGKYARTISQFAPAAAMPGSAVRRVANVVVPGAASEAGGQMTEGTPMEPYARLAGAVLGAGTVSAVGRPGPRTSILAEATRGATDDQIAAARLLMEDAGQRGIRLTMAEALQQVTDSGTGMGRLQRVVEGTRGGSERIAPVMAERPGQVRAALTDFADTIAPPTQQPSMIGAAAQGSADDALNGVRRYINSVVQPHYDALIGQELPPAQYQQIAQNPSYQQALAALRNHPELGATVADLPDSNLSVINEVIKRLNTTAEQARPGPMNPMGDNGLAALRDQGAGLAADVAAQSSDDFAAARQGVAAGRQAYLEPLQRGPLGRIAGTDDVRAQTGALFPSTPPEGMAAETAQALGMMGGPNGDVARGLVRQHIVNTASEATQDLQSGPNAWGGAKWAATQAGNPQQAATLGAGVEAVGGDRAQLDRLLEALRATGKRQPPGSQTAYNAKDLEELGRAGVTGEVLQGIASGPSTFRKIADYLQNWQTERNAGRLAEAILANPADAERILLHARRVVPQGQALQTIEQLALTAQVARQQQEGR